MIVSMWMTRDLVTIAPDAPIAEAAALMSAKHIRRLLVVEAPAGKPQLAGMLTATDIFHAYPPNINPFGLVPEAFRTRITAGDIMHRELTTTTPEAPIEEAARLMQDRKVGALPVLRDATLVGLITESDIFRGFVNMFELLPGGARITFDVTKGEDVLGLMSQLSRRHGVRVVSLIAAQQHDRPVCVVRVLGAAVDPLIEELWKSGHHVVNVLRTPAAEEPKGGRP